MTCIHGYTTKEVKTLLEDYEDFKQWLQEESEHHACFHHCDGLEWSHDVESFLRTGCGPHNWVISENLLNRYLEQRGI